MNRRWCLPLLAVPMFLALFSCRKETDTRDPVVVFSAPPENQQFDIPDTIPVRATVTDDQALRSVSVVIVNEDLAPVSYSVNFSAAGTSWKVDTSILIDDILIDSGNYFVKIVASDGTNTKNGFKRIRINGTPRRYRYSLLVTRHESQWLKVLRVDSVFRASGLFDVSSDYGGSDVSSRDHEFCLAGRACGACSAYDLNTLKLAWEVTAIAHPPAPCFENVLYSSPYFYINFHDSKTLGLDKDGKSRFSLTLPHDQYFVKMLEAGDYLALDRRYKTGPETFLDLYYAKAGGIFRQEPLNREVVGMFSDGGNNLVIFANHDGQGEILVYDIAGSSFLEPLSLPAERVLCAGQVSQNSYLVGLPSGVYWYNYAHNSLVEFAPVTDPVCIRYEELSGLVYIATPLALKVLTFPAGEQLEEIAVPDTILNFHLVYNK